MVTTVDNEGLYIRNVMQEQNLNVLTKKRIYTYMVMKVLVN